MFNLSYFYIAYILLKAFDSLFNGQFQCDNMPRHWRSIVYSETDFQQ